MILHRYFANRFLVIFLTVIAIFTLFIGLIAYVEQLRQVGDRADATQVAILVRLADCIFRSFNGFTSLPGNQHARRSHTEINTGRFTPWEMWSIMAQ